MKIAITGHRPNKLENDYDLVSPLIKSITARILEELRIIGNTYPESQRTLKNFTFITGMALGIDTLFAKIAIEFNIPFIAAIPFVGQQGKWLSKSEKVYWEILSKASNIILVDKNISISFGDLMMLDTKLPNGEYSPAKMQKRNEWMVDNCDILIAVWDGTSGGTANCYNYAIKKGKTIIRINPKLLK